MPVINGQKMACEPCIRGHRSTKCAHAGDRLLLPVRKPGRPLSTCPHPPGKTCQCRNVTAALPRGSSCRCSSTPSNKTNGTPAIVKAEPSDNPPQSPTKQASFRIQKPAPKPSRKQSSDASALQRMDPNSLNLIGAGNTFQPAAPANTITSPDYTNYAPPLSNGNGHYPTYPHMIPHLDGPLDSSLLALNGGVVDAAPTSSSRNEISDHSTHSTVSPGTLTPGTSGSPYHTPTSSNGESSSQEPSREAPSSCCSQRVQQQQPPIQNHMQFHGQIQNGPQASSNMMGYIPQIHAGNGSMVAQFPQQIAPNQQMYPMNNFHPQSLFSEQALFGTHLSPLQQSQWEQLVANLFPQAEPNGNSYTNHVCDCGPDCQCIGCAAHPYNQVTTQYVREAMAFQEFSVNGKLDTSNSIRDPPLAVGETSPPPTHSPSDAESPGANDLNLSPSEFLFVDYSSGMCACGDDCACVNCMIHRDTLGSKMNGESQDKTPN
ncbi:hypothetical protein F5Y04DRAFT_119806 [Hypomontagnella monticulosa]|nr:hypothetical protein F5Y04DRAFT_119806 [Hypomontagnella monticulosa]